MKIKLALASVLCLVLFAGALCAQTATMYRIAPYATAPGYCSPLNGDVFTLIGAGPVGAVYSCTAPNTWTLLGTAPNGVWLDAQGNIVASTPFVQHTATWNNAGVTFVDDLRNITITNAAYPSFFLNFEVAGSPVFQVDTNGDIGNFQPIQTASNPWLTHTSTWNNAAVSFIDDLRTITNTASASGSAFQKFYVGASPVFTVLATGEIDDASNIQAGTSAEFSWLNRSRLISNADGRIAIYRNDRTTFTALTLGPEAVTYPQITVSQPVGGKTQGIIINRGDGTNAVFADLGAGTNGSMIYCSDCKIQAVCAGAGTGAIAKLLNGTWVCN